MAFQNKGFWVLKGTEQINNGDTDFGNLSKIEQKRSHQWFLNPAEVQLFPNKKQAVEDSNNKTMSDISNASRSSWENISTFESVPNRYMDRLFCSETRNVSCAEKNKDCTVTDSNMTGNAIADRYGEDASFGLSTSHAAEDSDTLFNFAGIKRVKEYEDKYPDNVLHASNGENNDFNQSDGRHDYRTSASMGQVYNVEDDTPASIRHTYDHGNPHAKSLDSPYQEGDDNGLSIGDSCRKVDGNLICFSGFPDEQDNIIVGNLSGQYVPSCNQLRQAFEATEEKDLGMSNSNVVGSAPQVAKAKSESASKHKGYLKVAKKEAPNSFPSNVRSLISTGMLDGVPVKYVSLQQKELRGIIKGSGYLCGCQTCNYSKVLNAYEFERHSGCKTKHPNNRIFFENGKTIYQIVQGLRNTPDSLLFDTIQTVFGAPINQKYFRIWKESFQAASRELQRIYGKDQLNL